MSGTVQPPVVMLAAGMAKRYGGCKPLAPVGPAGEAIIDLAVGDALQAGFGRIVLVLGPATGPAISYHVERCWPDAVQVDSVEQAVPLGTAHAVLRARSLVGDGPFCVVNADDIYGTGPLTVLASHLAGGGGHALVSFPLHDTVLTPAPVTRGICQVDGEGRLTGLVERRKVTMTTDGFVAEDGVEPRTLDPDAPVSMNLRGFGPTIWPVLEEAVRATHPWVGPDGAASDATGTPPAAERSDTEVLLPEVVGAEIAAGGGFCVRVLTGAGRCVGVTHAEDLPVARGELAGMVGRGERPASAWEGVGRV